MLLRLGDPAWDALPPTGLCASKDLNDFTRLDFFFELPLFRHLPYMAGASDDHHDNQETQQRTTDER